MLKRDEISKPNSCLNRANDDAMLFVLIDKDPAMAATVQFWIEERIRLGLNQRNDPKILSAMIIVSDVTTKHEKGIS